MQTSASAVLGIRVDAAPRAVSGAWCDRAGFLLIMACMLNPPPQNISARLSRHPRTPPPYGSARWIVACLLTLLSVSASQAQWPQLASENEAAAAALARTAALSSTEQGSSHAVRQDYGSYRVTPAGDAADQTMLDMANAFRRKDSATLTALRPQTTGHVLEPWAAYWELTARLPSATAAEVDAFLQRWAGTYQEDRLRNDWLLQLGKQRDFATFDRYYPDFRMRDDRQVRCYALYSQIQRGHITPDDATVLRDNWYTLRDTDDACTLAAGALYARGAISADLIWHKARLAAQRGRTAVAHQAIALMRADAAAQAERAISHPKDYLSLLHSYIADQTATPGVNAAFSPIHQQLAVLALTRLAAQSPDQAAYAVIQQGWAQWLDAASLGWVWGEIGRQAALNLDAQALHWYAQTANLALYDAQQLAWLARAALRAGQWGRVMQAIDAMPATMQQQPVWTYWRARALAATDAQHPHIQQLYQRIASNHGFYELLAQEALGQPASLPTAISLSAHELQTATAHPGLQRALYARALGLESEANREWNYTTNLHQAGGMHTRDLLAAAELACLHGWWDRCINTSKRTGERTIHMAQRFPIPAPYQQAIISYSRQMGLNPVLILGLIRQESRFVPRARSSAGASGLMQVMPGTARLVARKLGLDYTPSQLRQPEVNLQMGTGYLRLMLDEFEQSWPLAAAAYNAGPGRPRRWRNGPVLEGAIWVENIPFHETREYVQKVLANATNYSMVLGVTPHQSLTHRLGHIAPAPKPEPALGAADDAVRTSLRATAPETPSAEPALEQP